jgi:DNA-binding transcriptional MerR regulator
MSDETLFTLKQLAEQLGLPESTIRYYRDAFLDHIPSVGTGRRRRYPAQAVAVLRTIAKSYASGRSRAEIIAAIHDRAGTSAQSVTAMPAEKAQRTVPLEDVTNVDLLAAILDGEREQRDALWQMAKEIVRLTEVLESQDKVLNEIADQAGVGTGAPRLQYTSAPLLSSPATPAPPPATAAFPDEPEHEPVLRHSMAHEVVEEAPAPPSASFTPPPSPAVAPISMPNFDLRRDDIAEVEPLPRFSGSGDSDMSRLKAELESERALVERLRESKLQLEHRAADAEAALEERNRGKRPSVIRRLLGGEGER